MILSKVGAIESSQATELLTSTLNGYKMEAQDAMHVVDALSAVDLAAATSVEELAVALQSTANMARVNGVGFEQLIGMIGAVSETTRRSASVVGNSFKTLFSRLTNVAAGKMIDDMGEPLNDVETTLQKLNISLRSSTSEFRNMYDVIAEIADKWDTFSDVQKNQISTAVAGTRQREIWETLMANWDRAKDLAKEAVTSDGMAMDKMQVYLESIEAHVKQLKAAVEDLVYSEGIVNFINLVIDSLRKLIETIDFLINNPIGKLISISAAATLAWTKYQKAVELFSTSKKVLGSVTELKGLAAVLGKISGLKGAVTSGLSSISSAFVAAGGGVAGFTSAIKVAGAALMSSPFVAVTAVIGGIALITKAMDALTVSTEEAKEALADNDSKISEYESEVSDLKSKQKDVGLTDLEQKRLDILKKQLEVLKDQRAVLELDVKNKELEDVIADGSYKAYDTSNFLSTMTDFLWNTPATEWMSKDGLVSLKTAINDVKVLKEEMSQIPVDGEDSAEKWNELNNKLLAAEEYILNIANAANDAKLSAEAAGEPVDENVKLIEALLSGTEYWGGALDAAANSASGVANELGETGDDLARITSEVSGLQSAYDNLISVNEEVANTGVISIETLDALVSRYPTLNEAVTNYLLGLASTEDVLAELRLAYQDDEANAYANIINKLKMQQNYHSLLSTMDSALMQQFAANYGIDIGNHGTYAQSKEKIEADLLQRVSSMWAQFYKSQALTMDNVIKAANGALKPDGDSLLPTSEINALKNVVNSYNDAIQGLNSVYDESIKLRLDGYKQVSSAAKDAAKAGGSASSKQSEQEKAYNDLLQMTIKMLKKKKELEKEALKEQLDGYKKVIDAQKDLLDLQDDEYNHKREVEDQNKNISSLEAQIAELQFDTSAEGTKKRLELEEELAEAKRDLEDYQHDYSIDQQKDALDREEQRFEEYINGQIDEIDRYLDKTGEITAEAIRLINERSEALFNDLIQYNRAYGDSLDQTVIDAWNGAVGAVNNYKSALDSAAESASRLASITGGASSSSMPVVGGGGSFNQGSGAGREDVINKKPNVYRIYKTNGTLVTEKNSLSEIKKIWGYIPDPSNYYWIKSINGGAFTGPTFGTPYHTGLDAGFVGGLKGNEEFVKALKGEAFITKEQQNRFMNKILPDIVSTGASSLGSMSFGNLLNIEVQGNLDSSVVPRIEDITKDVVKQINQTMFRGGYKRNTSVVPI